MGCLNLTYNNNFTFLKGGKNLGRDYRFGFNGQMKDNEVKGTGNSLDFGARIYDSRLGRWLSVDPLTAKFAMLTPYQYASNSPIGMIDLDGLEGLSIHVLLKRMQLDCNPQIKNPNAMDIIEHGMLTNKFNSSHLDKVLTYNKSNTARELSSNHTYGYEANNYHDCITTFQHGINLLYGTKFTFKYVGNTIDPTSKKLVTGAYEKLKDAGMVGADKTVSIITASGKTGQQGDIVTNTSESIAAFGEATTPPNSIGFFGLSIMDGHHTMMLVVDKRGGETSFRLLDQHAKSPTLDREKNLTASEVDKYIVDFAKANKAIPNKREAKLFQLLRIKL